MPEIVNPKWVRAAAAVAVLFGAITVFSGGTALFGSAVLRAAYGDVVPHVLWFNFLAGFAYVLAGIGLFRSRRWAASSPRRGASRSATPSRPTRRSIPATRAGRCSTPPAA